MNGRYTIVLKNCAFFSTHGVMPEEETLGQRFYVDATLNIIDENAVLNDDFSAAVDYGEVYKVISEVVTKRRFRLIEALAHAIAVAVCDRYAPIRSVEIVVRKPSAPVHGLLDYAEARVSYDAG
ncbi:dihydroneopterin aldolase [Martelella endophytica]|uniref:7,8-dihydroneopterin aldolase n=1 Tax=Martelella endophytica TaxID=1486262 RepID=A0A0D5LRW7_MAREN|nr:dihydroneopterin aldolase [Martelella endophytica]AJY46710.1 dienelactone hydrolase [Martelella endophytica]